MKFGGENSHNPCLKDHNCPAACCRDMILKVTLEEASRVIPEGESYTIVKHDLGLNTTKAAITLCSSHNNPVPSYGRPREDALANYRRTRKHANSEALISITGPCPRLSRDTENPQCTIYETRPKTCRQLALGGLNCNGIRRDFGLGFIPLETK